MVLKTNYIPHKLMGVLTNPCLNTSQSVFMMMSSNGNIFRVTGHLCRASDAEL